MRLLAPPPREIRLRRLLGCFVVPSAALLSINVALSQKANAQVPDLGTASNFAVLAGSTVTNTGSSVLLGNLGLSPGNAITGFPPGIVLPPGGTFVSDAVAIQAQIDLAIGYNATASRPATADLTGQNLGGLTLTPGVYNFATAAQLNGNLTLNALGNPNSLFIFNVGSTLTTGSSSSVTVIGGGLGSNVYWRVGSSATLGTTTSFVGDILALTSITLNTGANITCGSALARNGAVTLDTNNIAIRNLSPCAVTTLLPTTPGSTTPGGTTVGAGTTATGVTGVINGAFARAIGPGNTLSNDFPAAFLGLAALSPSAQVIALQQLAGEASTGVAPTGVQAMNSFLSLVLNPYAGGGRSDFGPAAPAATAPAIRARGYAQENSMPLKASAIFGSVKASPPASDFDRKAWSIWAAGYGGQSEFDGNSTRGTHALTSRTYGFATGLDYHVVPNAIIGFALGGGGTNFGLSDGLGGGHSDMFQAALYSSTRIGAAYLSAAVAYAWHDVTTDQYLSVIGTDHLKASFDANNIGGRIEGGYRFGIPSRIGTAELGVTPYGAFQAQAFFTPSYSEDPASAFARSYAARTLNATRTELGARFDQRLAAQNGNVLTLRGRTAWANDYWSNENISTAFVSLPGSGFSIAGASTPRNLLLASVGAEMQFRNGYSIAAQFEGEYADHFARYGGSGKLRYTW